MVVVRLHGFARDNRGYFGHTGAYSRLAGTSLGQLAEALLHVRMMWHSSTESEESRRIIIEPTKLDR